MPDYLIPGTLRNTLDQQRRLFDFSPTTDLFLKTEVENTFLDKGYLIKNNISNEFEAISVAYEILSGLREKQLFYSKFLSQVQLSKGDLIPVCDPFIEGGFQALHFDYGLPLIGSNEAQYEPFDMFSVLYYPCNIKPFSGAVTRLVTLQNLHIKVDLDETVIESRIDNYVKHHGDGWLHPEPYNTKRISIYARVLDAVLDLKQFEAKIDCHSQNFFFPEETMASWELTDKQLEMEYEFYKDSGIDLHQIEKRIILQPGQLLFIDNMRTIHGRLGFRRKKEIWQFLFGLERSSPELIQKTKEFIIKSISRK
jgi:hypothetical protein